MGAVLESIWLNASQMSVVPGFGLMPQLLDDFSDFRLKSFQVNGRRHVALDFLAQSLGLHCCGRFRFAS